MRYSVILRFVRTNTKRVVLQNLVLYRFRVSTWHQENWGRSCLGKGDILREENWRPSGVHGSWSNKRTLPETEQDGGRWTLLQTTRKRPRETLPKGDYINQGYCCYYGTCRRTFGVNFLRSTTNFTSSKWTFTFIDHLEEIRYNL